MCATPPPLDHDASPALAGSSGIRVGTSPPASAGHLTARASQRARPPVPPRVLRPLSRTHGTTRRRRSAQQAARSDAQQAARTARRMPRSRVRPRASQPRALSLPPAAAGGGCCRRGASSLCASTAGSQPFGSVRAAARTPSPPAVRPPRARARWAEPRSDQLGCVAPILRSLSLLAPSSAPFPDRCCLRAEELSTLLPCLPLYCAACDRLLALRGPTYLGRLW
jgi:hypothetical protein